MGKYGRKALPGCLWRRTIKDTCHETFFIGQCRSFSCVLRVCLTVDVRSDISRTSLRLSSCVAMLGLKSHCPDRTCSSLNAVSKPMMDLAICVDRDRILGPDVKAAPILNRPSLRY